MATLRGTESGKSDSRDKTWCVTGSTLACWENSLHSEPRCQEALTEILTEIQCGGGLWEEILPTSRIDNNNTELVVYEALATKSRSEKQSPHFPHKLHTWDFATIQVEVKLSNLFCISQWFFTTPTNIDNHCINFPNTLQFISHLHKIIHMAKNLLVRAVKSVFSPLHIWSLNKHSREEKTDSA